MDLLHREHQQHRRISAGIGVGYGISGYRPIAVRNMRWLWNSWRQARRGGERDSFPGPRDVWGPRHRSILPICHKPKTGVSGGFFLTSNIHEIHFPAGLRSWPRWEAYDARQTPSRMVWGHTSQVSFLRSRRICWGCGRAPGEWFPGPCCGCRRSWLEIERNWLSKIWQKIDYNSACMAHRSQMFAPTRGFSGMADSMEPYKMLWGRPLLPWQRNLG